MCEMSAIMQQFEHSLALPFIKTGMIWMIFLFKMIKVSMYPPSLSYSSLWILDSLVFVPSEAGSRQGLKGRD